MTLALMACPAASLSLVRSACANSGTATRSSAIIASVDLTDPAALAISCRICAAPAGSLCTSERGTPYPRLHQARRREAHGAEPAPPASPRKKRGARRQAADARYRAALGMDQGDRLPKNLGVASSAGSGRTGNKRKNPVRRTGRRPVVGVARAGEHNQRTRQASSKAQATKPAATKTVQSAFAGREQRATSESRCPMCTKQITVGAMVVESDGRWLHRGRASKLQAIQANRESILSGETFRGRKPSDWRRGSSPSSSRSRRY